MKLLVFLLCLFFSINAVNAQSASSRNSQSSSAVTEDTAKVILGSDASGRQLFIKNGKAQAEPMGAVLQSKQNVSLAGSEKKVAATVADTRTNARTASPTTIQKNGKESGSAQPAHKLPPPLVEGPPKN